MSVFEPHDAANGGAQPSISAALPTGVAATDTAVLQALVTAINATGGNVDAVLAPGTYVVNAALGTITVPGVRIFGHGVNVTTIDFSAAPLNATCLQFAGSVGTHKALTADTTVAGSTLTCAAGDEAGLSADDFILIGSEAYYEQRTLLYGALTGQKIGEIATVASTVSGTVSLREPLAGGYTDEAAAAQQVYKTTDTGFFAKLTLLADVGVEGIKFIGATGSGTGSTQNAVNFNLCKGVRLRDVRFEHVAYCGALLQDCIDFIVERWAAFDCWNTNTGYGVAVGNASQDGLVSYGHYRRGRHAVTGTGSANSSGYGVSRRITVAYVKTYDNTADGFKTHACCGHWEFVGCKAYGSNLNGATGHGFLAESNDVTLLGCWVGQNRCGAMFANETLNPTRFQVTGFVTRNASLDGVRYAAPSTTGAEPMVEYAQFTTITAVNPTSVGFYMKGVSGHALVGVEANGITVYRAGSTTASVYFQFCTQPTASNIKVRQAPNGTIIRFEQTTKATLSGWDVESASAGTGTAVIVQTSSTDAKITGGGCANAATGISLDSTATNCVVTGNNVSGCTTPISPSTGTGHKIAHNIGDVKAQTSISLTGSPFTFLNTGPRDTLVAISGGTVSLVEISNNGTNFSTVGTSTNQAIYTPVNGAVRVTYTVAPTMNSSPIL